MLTLAQYEQHIASKTVDRRELKSKLAVIRSDLDFPHVAESAVKLATVRVEELKAELAAAQARLEQALHRADKPARQAEYSTLCDDLEFVELELSELIEERNTLAKQEVRQEAEAITNKMLSAAKMMLAKLTPEMQKALLENLLGDSANAAEPTQ